MKKSFADQESLAQYLSSLDILQEAVLLIDKKGIVHGSSSNVLEDLGYESKNELPGTLFEINPSLHLKKWNRLWQLMQEEGQQVMDTEHITREGIIFPVKLQTKLIQKNGEQIAYCRIINARETRVHKQLLKLTNKMTGTGGWQYDILNDKITITESLYDLLRIDRPNKQPDKTWVLDQLNKLLSRETIQSLTTKFNAAVNSGSETKLEIPVKNPGHPNTILYSRIIPVTYENNTLQLFGTVHDLSNLSHETTEMALARHTLHHLQEMIYWLDPHGSIIFANQSFRNRMNIDKNKLEHYRISQFMPGFDENDLINEWEKLKQDKLINKEGLLKAPNQSPFPVEISISLFEYENKEYSCTVLRDISMRKKMEANREVQWQEIQQLKEKLEGENALLREEIELQYEHDEIVSESEEYKKILHFAEQVAPTETTVLITGETGTGKELIANTIHRLSHRSSSPLIKVNCAALPSSLIESELFGHEKGAFTGATQLKKGRFERADKGTLFLDEIGDLPMSLQAKLLRVLQDGKFERVGGTRSLNVDVRVITATNRNLEKLVNQGKYRKDLYYRLNVYPIHNIPLRNRTEDIPALVRHFVDKYSKKMGKSIEKIPQTSLEKLMQYHFPGNIRELENIIERALVLTRGKTLQLEPVLQTGMQMQISSPKRRFKTLDEIQKEHILKALEQCRWKVSGKGGAAELLQINPKTLWSRMKKLNIQ